jgi:hypothetical protein
MTRHHNDHTDEETPKQSSPADALEQRLKRLAREAKAAELERQLTDEKRRKGKR